MWLGVYVLLGVVSSCPVGWFGPNCASQCWRCKAACDVTGVCLDDCPVGWSGPYCSNQCWTCGGQGECDRATGRCLTCNAAWGQFCETQCGMRCGGVCDRETGECPICDRGYYGDKCQTQCWTCGGDGECDKITGKCVACRPGYSGEWCETQCWWCPYCSRGGDCCLRGASECCVPTGESCDWYSTCLHNATPNCSIIESLMKRKCGEYLSLTPTLSEAGQKWAPYVRGCLQKKLASNWDKQRRALTCEQATNLFFGEHVDCYVNGNVSFCNLPFSDQRDIVRGALEIFKSQYWWDAFRSGSDLVSRCAQRLLQAEVKLGAQFVQNVSSQLQQVLTSSLARVGNFVVSVDELALEYVITVSSPLRTDPSTQPVFTAIRNALLEWRTQHDSMYEVTLNGQLVNN